MRTVRPFLAFCLIVAATRAQTQVSTQDLWALDIASNQIAVLNGGGGFTGTVIPLQGTGSARGLAFAPSGLCYVARGNDVRTYDGTTSTVFASNSNGIDQAQDVAVRPGTANEVWVACGTSTTNSKVIRFGANGTVISTLTDPNLIHPRRIAWNQTGSTLYVLSNVNKRIFSLDATSGTFTQLANLTTANVAPIGLTFDVTRNALWVVGDFGVTGDVGRVTIATGTYTPVITSGTIAGMAAPANVWFDRFRVLNVVSRALNGGTTGIYRFDASTGSTPIHLTDVTTTGTTSFIDVRGRPELVGIGAPSSSPNNYVLSASATAPVPISNPITFHVPRAANRIYAAALSPLWATACDPYVPGALEPVLRIPAPDARGIPLSLSDGGLLLQATAGVCCDPATGFPVSLFLTVSGFVGVLDANGDANATISIQPNPPVALNGFQMSLALVTVDPSVPSGFGRISDPICLTINIGP